MDTTRFDRLSRMLASPRSRRTIARALGGIAVPGALARLGLAPAAARDCLANGAVCVPASAANCCTGACKKHKGTFKCAPAGTAQGCTKALNSCNGAMAVCPEASGTFGECVNGKKGKPLCYSVGACIACKHDADCVGSLGLSARCIKGCPICVGMAGVNSACVLPVPSP